MFTVQQPKTVQSNQEEITPRPDLSHRKEGQTDNRHQVQVTMPLKHTCFETAFQESAIKGSLDQQSQLQILRSPLVPAQRFQLGLLLNQNMM
jgi:hypothetical protein